MARTPGRRPLRPEKEARQVQRVAGYVRVSTAYQKVSGLGLEAQRRMIEAMATVKGWPAPVIYADEGLSGAKETADRPQLQVLMADIEAGNVDAVIVSSMDRLARKARLMLSLAEDMQLYGVQLVSCKETIDTATPAGMLLFTVLAAMAQFERELASERTKAALAEHGLRDGERGGRLPYGYRRTLRGLVIMQQQAQAVRLIFRMRKAGATLRQIAQAVQEAGYVPPRGKGVWWPSSVAEIIKNEYAYKGGYRGESQIAWPVILESRRRQVRA